MIKGTPFLFMGDNSLVFPKGGTTKPLPFRSGRGGSGGGGRGDGRGSWCGGKGRALSLTFSDDPGELWILEW